MREGVGRPSWTLCKVSFRLALILMTCSLFLCREVHSPDELARVPLGLPIPFLTLDASGRAPLEYPACLRFDNPHGNTMRLRPLAALADLLLLTSLLVGGTRLVARLRGADRAARDGNAG